MQKAENGFDLIQKHAKVEKELQKVKVPKEMELEKIKIQRKDFQRKVVKKSKSDKCTQKHSKVSRRKG